MSASPGPLKSAAWVAGEKSSFAESCSNPMPYVERKSGLYAQVNSSSCYINRRLVNIFTIWSSVSHGLRDEVEWRKRQRCRGGRKTEEQVRLSVRYTGERQLQEKKSNTDQPRVEKEASS